MNTLTIDEYSNGESIKTILRHMHMRLRKQISRPFQHAIDEYHALHSYYLKFQKEFKTPFQNYLHDVTPRSELTLFDIEPSISSTAPNLFSILKYTNQRHYVDISKGLTEFVILVKLYLYYKRLLRYIQQQSVQREQPHTDPQQRKQSHVPDNSTKYSRPESQPKREETVRSVPQPPRIPSLFQKIAEVEKSRAQGIYSSQKIVKTSETNVRDSGSTRLYNREGIRRRSDVQGKRMSQGNLDMAPIKEMQENRLSTGNMETTTIKESWETSRNNVNTSPIKEKYQRRLSKGNTNASQTKTTQRKELYDINIETAQVKGTIKPNNARSSAGDNTKESKSLEKQDKDRKTPDNSDTNENKQPEKQDKDTKSPEKIDTNDNKQPEKQDKGTKSPETIDTHGDKSQVKVHPQKEISDTNDEQFTEKIDNIDNRSTDKLNNNDNQSTEKPNINDNRSTEKPDDNVNRTTEKPDDNDNRTTENVKNITEDDKDTEKHNGGNKAPMTTETNGASEEKSKKSPEPKSREYDDLKKTYNILLKENQSLKNEIQELTTRLSQLTSKQMTEAKDNDTIDMNSPEKIADMFTDFYDKEWSDSYEGLQSIYRSDRDIILMLRGFLSSAYNFCQEAALSVLEKLKTSVENVIVCPEVNLEGQIETYIGSGNLDKEKLDKIAKQLLKSLGTSSVSGLSTIFKLHSIVQKLPITDEEPLRKILSFVDRAVELTWLMNIQDPPMILKFARNGDKVKTDVYSNYEKDGDLIDICVWPALYLSENGDLLKKGHVLPV